MTMKKKIKIGLICLLIIGIILIIGKGTTNENIDLDNKNVIIGTYHYFDSSISPEPDWCGRIVNNQRIGSIGFVFKNPIDCSEFSKTRKARKPLHSIEEGRQIMLTGEFVEQELPTPNMMGWDKTGTVRYFIADEYQYIDFYELSLEPSELLKYINGDPGNFALHIKNPLNQELNLFVDFWGNFELNNTLTKTISLAPLEEKDIELNYQFNERISKHFNFRIKTYTDEWYNSTKRYELPLVGEYNGKYSLFGEYEDIGLILNYDKSFLKTLETLLDDNEQKNKKIILEIYKKLSEKYNYKSEYTSLKEDKMDSEICISPCFKTTRYGKKCYHTLKYLRNDEFYLILVVRNEGKTITHNVGFYFPQDVDYAIEKIEYYDKQLNDYVEVSENYTFDKIIPLNQKTDIEKILSYDIKVPEDIHRFALKIKANHKGWIPIKFYFDDKFYSYKVQISEKYITL